MSIKLAKLTQILWLLSGFMFLNISNAAVVANLYTATMPVASESHADREQAAALALQEVLIKVSGNAKLAVDLDVNPLQLLQKWEYLQDGESLTIQCQFNSEKVDSFLRKAGQSAWRADRPLTTAWIAVQDEDGKHLATNDSDPELSSALEARANMRGVPVLIPMFDLTDLAEINVDKVWALSAAPASKAAKRYNSHAQLLGKMTKVDNQDKPWQAQWLLLLEDDKVSWQTNGATVTEVMDKAVDKVADSLVKEYVMLPKKSTGPVEPVVLAVTGIKDMDTFTRINRYLNSIHVVSGLTVQGIHDNQVTFELDVAGGEQSLVQSLALDKLLLPQNTTAPEQAMQQLQYHLAV